MAKKHTLLVFILTCTLVKASCQDTTTQYFLRLEKNKTQILDQINIISCDKANKSFVLYSVFNLDFNIVITKGKDFFRLFFFRSLLTDSIPLLLYYTSFPLKDENCQKIFDSHLYKIGDNYPSTSAKDSILDYNKSDFYYFDANGRVVVEFHLPTFRSRNPLSDYLMFLLHKRDELIFRFIFESSSGW